MEHSKWLDVSKTYRPSLKGFLVLWLLFLSIGNGFAIAQSSEPYVVRPRIEATVPHSHPELGVTWEKLRDSQLEFVAQLLGLYADSDLYFLARDAELLYDTARLLADAEELPRIHLLNISRKNSNDPLLVDYLKQEGFTPAQDGSRVTFGKKILVDTGFIGSIAEQIGLAMHAETPVCHLLCSTVDRCPSSRVALMQFNALAAELNPSYFKTTIAAYENMSRFTLSSDHFEIQNGKIHPMSEKPSGAEQLSNRRRSIAYQEDLKAYILRKEVRQSMEVRKNLWKELRSLALQKKSEQVIAAILAATQSLPDGTRRAMLKDLVVFAQKNLDLPEGTAIKLSDFGLDAEPRRYSVEQLAERHPEWQPFLLHWEKGVQFLIEQADYLTLAAIFTQLLPDRDVARVLFTQLGAHPGPDSDSRVIFIDSLINKKEDHVLQALAEFTFQGEVSRTFGTTGFLLDFLVYKGSVEIHRILVSMAFTLDYVALEPRFGFWLRTLMKSSDRVVLNQLMDRVFTQDYWEYRKDYGALLRYFVQIADAEALHRLRHTVFQTPRVQKLPEYAVLKHALTLEDRVEREGYLLEQLGRIDWKALWSDCNLNFYSMDRVGKKPMQ